MNLANAKVMINPVFMQIVIVSHKFLNRPIKLVIMFLFKLLKTNLNIVPETVIFGICGYILIEPKYCIFVEDVIISCLNVYAIIQEDF